MCKQNSPSSEQSDQGQFFCFLQQMIGPYNQLEDSILEFQDLKSLSAILQKLRDIVGRVNLL